jgi:hypothetical protein
MPVTKPTVLPDWASSTTGLARTTAPPSQDVLDGWAPGYRPPAQYLNWNFRQTTNWLKWLQDINNQAFTWSSAQAFSAGLTGSTATLTGALSAASAVLSGALTAASGVLTGGLTIDSAGANIGTITSSLKLGGGGEGIGSKRNAGGNVNGLDFYTASTARMQIANGGQVSINGGLAVLAGGISVTAGGVNVSGGSQFNSGLTVAGGTLAAAAVTASSLGVTGNYTSTSGNVTCATLKGTGGGLYAPLNLGGGAIGRPGGTGGITTPNDGDIWIENHTDGQAHLFIKSAGVIHVLTNLT